MTCENNKKGCNNKILIRTLMLESMVCILSVSDMFGMNPNGTPIDPNEAMKKINNNENYYKEFMKIFKDHEDLIKRKCCCCGDIDIEHTKLPTTKENGDKSSVALGSYIIYRFTLNEKGVAEIDKNWVQDMGACEAFDSIIFKIYTAPPS